MTSIHITPEIKLSIFIGICLSIFLLGLFSRTENAIGANQCKMTYTSMDHKLIPVKSDIQGPLLYKYSNALNKKLNKQPVLFIPGHQGRYAMWCSNHFLLLTLSDPSQFRSAVLFYLLSPSFPSNTLFYYGILPIIIFLIPVFFDCFFPSSFDQVRSLSSSMHNDDDFFQYFTLDFQAADTAYHGGSSIFSYLFCASTLLS